jgi:hypothetical protein
MIRFDNQKLTPNELAKVLIARYGESAFYWPEKIDTEGITESEQEQISERVEHHWRRLEKFLLNEKLERIWL